MLAFKYIESLQHISNWAAVCIKTLVISYHDGKMTFAKHPVGFDFSVLMSNWFDKLFSSKGILRSNLALLILPFAVPFILNHPQRVLLVISLLSATLYTLYIFSYSMWSVTVYGNRFLLPAIYLCLIPIIIFVGQLEGRLNKQHR